MSDYWKSPRQKAWDRMPRCQIERRGGRGRGVRGLRRERVDRLWSRARGRREALQMKGFSVRDVKVADGSEDPT
eukprot:5169544-Pyramimonas_sp.AAC.1